MALGENMEKLRNAHGFTQEEVAESVNVTKQAMSKYENNQMKPQPEVLLMIAKKLGVTCEELITGEPQTTQTAPKQ